MIKREFEAQISTVNFSAPTGPAGAGCSFELKKIKIFLATPFFQNSVAVLPPGPIPVPGRDRDLSNQGKALGLSAQGQGCAQVEPDLRPD